MMKWNARRNSRKIHRLVAIIISLPFLIILITGLLLQVKKEVAWIQPISQEGISNTPSITFEQILEVSQSIPEAEISSWDPKSTKFMKCQFKLMKMIMNYLDRFS